jgi:hypothetical protein
MITKMEAFAFVSGIMALDFEGPDMTQFKASRQGNGWIVTTGTARGPFHVMREALSFHYVIVE